MKRIYEKPSIAVESYQLDAAIAGSCADAGYTVIGFSADDCGLFEGSDEYIYMYFNSTNCTIDVTGEDVYHGVGPFISS